MSIRKELTAQNVLLGFQHVLVSNVWLDPVFVAGAIGLPIALSSNMINAIFIVSGLVTLVQATRLVRLPVVQGPSAAFDALMIAAGTAGMLGAASSSILIASLVFLLLCLTGVIEQHITSDIIFALWQYYTATGDQDFMDRYGYEMIIETARFWNSRLEWIEENNRYEIRDVIGPDEYKEHVDNNAYTNYMAHENMRLAAQVIACIRDEKKDIYGKMQKLMQEEGTSLEQLEEELKDKMKKLYLPQPDEKTGIIPQFDGYFDLKEIDLSVYKNASVVGTIFHDYSGEDVQGMQAGKQADIVELLYQMEDITTPDNKAKNYVYYEARTLHDSSLSKAIHSITACDLGMEKEAYEMFMSAALTDLGQEMKSSDAGIHSANMGGVWQDVVMGFGGIRIRDGHLRIAPNCPKQWEKFTYPIYWKGNKLDVTVCKDGVEVINEGTAFMAEIMGQMVTVEKGKNEFLA